MATTVAQHSVATFTSPVNGTTPIDANTVRGNDNTIRTAYNDHDADPGIHVQSSTLASRPVAGTAGRKWITTDAGNQKLWYDDGTDWHEVGGDSINLYCRATETLAKGDVVKITGYNNGQNVPEIAKVSSASDVAFGICETAIASGSLGYVINTGVISDVNTGAFSLGNILYPNTSGGLTTTKPTSGTYQPVAYVLRAHASQGTLYVEFSAPRIVERSDNTVSTVVLRDASGNFSAGTITATTLNATTVNATTFDMTNLEVTNIKAKDGTSAATIADSTGVVTFTSTVSGSITGNAGTATALQTARNINGVSFNGTADITVTAAAGTLTGTTLASGVTASSLTSVGTLSSLTVSGNTIVGAEVYRSSGTSFMRLDGGSGSGSGANIIAFGESHATAPGRISMSAVGTGAIQMNTGGALRASLDSSGNLGLGVTPSAWGSTINALQMGTASFTAAKTGNTPAGSMYVNSFFDGTGFKYVASDYATRYASFSGQHVWYTAPSGTAGNAITFTQAMTLDASGRLLLGRTSGTYGLDLTSVDGNLFRFTRSTDELGSFISSNVAFFGTTTSTPLAFMINSAEKARITSGGNVLVGKSADDTTTVGVQITSGGIVNSAGTTDFFNAYSTSAAAYRFYITNGGTIFATNTTISAISDARYKENVRDLTVGLDAVLALKPRVFDWKDGKGKNIKNDRGFIAQEFEQVFPDLIDEWKDPAPDGEAPYKSVRQDLIPVLVKAIQELTARVVALETN